MKELISKSVFGKGCTFSRPSKEQVISYSVHASNKALFFIPGVFLILLGAIAIMAPMLLIAAVSFFLLFFGIFFVFLAVKFLRMKKKFEEMTKQFQGRVIVQGVEVVDGETEFFMDEDELEEELEEEEALNKKIILH